MARSVETSFLCTPLIFVRYGLAALELPLQDISLQNAAGGSFLDPSRMSPKIKVALGFIAAKTIVDILLVALGGRTIVEMVANTTVVDQSRTGQEKAICRFAMGWRGFFFSSLCSKCISWIYSMFLCLFIYISMSVIYSVCSMYVCMMYV